MKSSLALISTAVLLAACSSLPTVGTRTETAVRQILLTVPEENAATTLALTGPPGNRYTRRQSYGPSPSVERRLNRLAREHDIVPVEGWPIASLKVYCEVFYVPRPLSIDAVVMQLSSDPGIDLVQPMNTFQTLTGGRLYDDPYADLQSAVRDLDVEDAHQWATGKDVLVAVIDSAVEADHPELRGRVSIDRDLVDGRLRPKKGEIHGTAVAGIIASASNNDEGIIGVAPDARIAALRACWATDDEDSSAQCSSFSLAKALEMALRLDPQVINLSLTGPFDPLLARLLEQAIRRGIVVVAAEPEDEDAQHSFPASQAQVIVARSEIPDPATLPRFRLPAPGREILTTTPDESYAFLSGNSLAAAHVSGVVALLKQRDPAMTQGQIADLLRDTASGEQGSASINACRALDRLVNRAAAQTQNHCLHSAAP
jgi:subtilisin family serine protease